MVKGGFSWSLRGTTRKTSPNLLLRAQTLKVILGLNELGTNVSQACKSPSWCKITLEIRRVESQNPDKAWILAVKYNFKKKQQNCIISISAIISKHSILFSKRSSLSLWWFASNLTLCKLQIENCLNLIIIGVFLINKATINMELQ